MSFGFLDTAHAVGYRGLIRAHHVVCNAATGSAFIQPLMVSSRPFGGPALPYWFAVGPQRVSPCGVLFDCGFQLFRYLHPVDEDFFVLGDDVELVFLNGQPTHA